jgi:DNA-binding NarL/FixJ family response regulator
MNVIPVAGRERAVADPSVVLIEDHDIVRFGLRELLERDRTARVVGECAGVVAGAQIIEDLEPDLVICDLAVEDSRGLDTLHAVVRAQRGRPVLVLSMQDDLLYAEQAIAAGAAGYAMKEEAHQTIVDVVQSLLRGERWVSARVRKQMLAGRSPGQAAGPAARTRSRAAGHWSEREIQIMERLARGQTTKEIAYALQLSPRTIDAIRARMKARLALRSGTELVAYAVAHF